MIEESRFKGPLYMVAASVCWSLGGICIYYMPWSAMSIIGLRALLAGLVFASLGGLYYWYIYNRYRNKKARFKHESETKSTVLNMNTVDNLLRRLTRLRNARMSDSNSTDVRYKF